MWTVAKVQGTEVLRGVLDEWKGGVDAHEPQKVESFPADRSEDLFEKVLEFPLLCPGEAL